MKRNPAIYVAVTVLVLVSQRVQELKFEGNVDLNKLVKSDGSVDPSKGISLDDATNWFTIIWENYQDDPFFDDYKKKKGHEWADEDVEGVFKSS